MATLNEIKFAWVSGYRLVFTAFAPDDTARGIIHQLLPEIYNTGYYRATPLTDLVVGDYVLVYRQENIYWEDELVVYLTPEHVFYEGEIVTYEGEYVFDFDSQLNERVYWIGNPIGAGEYDAVIERQEDIDTIVENQSIVEIRFDETGKGQTTVGD